MRTQQLKLQRGISTKYERRFMEILKKNRIKFRAKVKINGEEVDFLVGKYAVEIDGHKQNGYKNHRLANIGYIPIHYSNQEINPEINVNYLKKC
jgi:very-short-patch-repair endonuclease